MHYQKYTDLSALDLRPSQPSLAIVLLVDLLNITLRPKKYLWFLLHRQKKVGKRDFIFLIFNFIYPLSPYLVF